MVATQKDLERCLHLAIVDELPLVDGQRPPAVARHEGVLGTHGHLADLIIINFIYKDKYAQ